MTSSNTIATWSLELNTVCPECLGDINLLDIEGNFDLFDSNPELSPCQSSNDIEVYCVTCQHEFLVDLFYSG